jgi:hypothetical protein
MKIEPASGPLGVNDFLYRGILGHAALANYFAGISKNLSEAELLQIIWDTLQQNKVIRGRFDQLLLMDVFDLLVRFHNYRVAEIRKWRICAIEEESVYEIVPGELGTIIFPDLVADIPGKGLTVIDHKFKTNFLNFQELALSVQLPKYAVGLRDRWQIRRAIYNVLRTRKMKAPADEDLFVFQDVPLTSKRAINTFRDHILTSETINELRQSATIEEWESKIYRNPGPLCGYCDFALLCESDLNGLPTDNMLKHEFQPRSHRKSRELKVTE